MFGLGIGELLVILVIVMIIFGAGKLPDIGEGLGRGIRNFRKAVRTPDEIDVTPPRSESAAAPDSSPADGSPQPEKRENEGPQA
jgi:sec-independent protein translocase protein TatA